MLWNKFLKYHSKKNIFIRLEKKKLFGSKLTYIIHNVKLRQKCNEILLKQ